jgi:LysM repeat protein
LITEDPAVSYRARRRRFTSLTISAILAIAAIFYFLHHSHPAIVEAATDAMRTPATTQLTTTEPATTQEATTIPTTEPTTQSSVVADIAIADGQAKLQAGDFLAARQVLNDALVSGNADDDQSATIKKLIALANQTIIFSARHFGDDPYGGLITVEPGQRLARIAMNYSVTWEFLEQLNNLTNPKHLRAGQTLKIIKGPFNAVINKSAFTMDIWLGPPEKQGGLYVTTYRVGLGQDDSTPTGTWMVEPSRKLRNPTYFSPRGQGIIEADDPKNPLGKYWIGLTGTEGQALGKMSYGIHGTIDPTSIGHMSSLGCIRLGDADIAQVFQLLVDGKSMVIVRK